MKRDKHITKVQFLISTHSGQEDVFAFFPKEKYSQEIGVYNSYSHIGQHSACCIEYAKESRPATVEEYTPLKQELESIGYKLKICK